MSSWAALWDFCRTVFIFKTYYKTRQYVITIQDSSAYYNLRQRVITIYDSLVITFLDNCYYNLRQVLDVLQFTTEHPIICSFLSFALNSFSSFLHLNVVMSSLHLTVSSEDEWFSIRNVKLKKGASMLLFKYCSTIFADGVIFLITSFEILILLHGLRGELYWVKAYNEEAGHWIINSKRKEASFPIPIFDSVSSLYKGP